MVLPILGNRELGASVPTGENKAPAVSAGVFATIPVERSNVKLLKLLVIGFIILLQFKKCDKRTLHCGHIELDYLVSGEYQQKQRLSLDRCIVRCRKGSVSD